MTSSYFFFFFLSFVLFSLLCLQLLPSVRRRLTRCFYIELCMCPFTAAALQHIQTQTQSIMRKKKEREASFSSSSFFHQSIFLSHQSTTTTAPPHYTAVNRGHCICVYTTRHSTNRNNKFFLYACFRERRENDIVDEGNDYTGNSIASMQANKLNAVFFS